VPQAGNTVEHAGLLEAVDQAADGIVLTDIRGNIQFVNPAFTAMTGYTSEEVLGQNPRLLKSGRMSEEFYKQLWNTILSGNVWQGDVINKRKNGTFYNEEMRVAPVRDEHGKITGYIAIKHDVTERRVAEETQAFLAAIVENSEDSIIACTPDGTIRAFNHGAESVFGYSAIEAIGQHMSMLVPPDRYQALEMLAQELRKGERFSQHEGFCLRKDGSELQVSVSAFPIQNAAGEVVAISNILRDVAERKQLERQLRANELRFRGIFENAPFGMCVTGMDGHFIQVNEALCRVAGYTAPELLATSWEAITHPDDLISSFEKMGALVAGNLSFVDDELRNVDRLGNVVWVRVRVSLIRDCFGSPIHFVVHVEDITERRRARQALQCSEEKFRQLAENIREVFWMMDAAGTEIIYVSPAYEPIWGRTCASLYASPAEWMETIHPGDRKLVWNALKRQFRGECVDSEFRINTPEGQEKWIRNRAFPIRGEGGTLIRIAGVAEEITDRKHRDDELIRARKEADAANRIKSEFLANMSHEIRTPINGVVGMTELLLDTGLTSDQRHYAETICICGNSLLKVINNILDFSKIEARRLELEIEDFALDVVLQNLGASLALQAEGKGIELICIAAPEVPTKLRGDPGRLRQILTNLVGNAIKFTEKGEVAVRVALKETGESNCLLHFSVRDTGIGIPEDKIGILFDKFTQVKARTAKKCDGTGLGLAISKQLVEMMGGTVGVTSREGQGSEFWFTVRLGLRPGNESEAAEKNAQNRASLQGIRVLIVDDNATSREILTTMTASWGMRVVAAENGAVALTALYDARKKSDAFTIAVIDMRMPDMDGESLGRAIKADGRIADTRMILLTSLGTRANSQTPEQIGFSSSAFKPVRRDELCGILNRVLHDADESRPMPGRVASDSYREPAASLAGMNARVLLAEDNATNREVALGMLRKLGIHADAVADGAAAIIALASTSYDLVLMDVRMPVMDGIEAAKQIRNPNSAALNHDIPIVAITANSLESEKECCLAAGMSDFVPKPLSAAALREALEKWLRIGDIDTSLKVRHLVPAPPAESKTMVFDLDGVLARLEGDHTMAQVVFASFLEGLPQKIQALKHLVKSGDRAGSARLAHAICGASARVGGESLRSLAAAMEKAADEGDQDFLAAGMEKLEIQFHLLKDAIEENDPPTQSD
jgi:PAS domain S-box-containing protein